MFVDYAMIALPDSENSIYSSLLIITQERSKAISATHLLLYPEAVVCYKNVGYRDSMKR